MRVADAAARHAIFARLTNLCPAVGALSLPCPLLITSFHIGIKALLAQSLLTAARPQHPATHTYAVCAQIVPVGLATALDIGLSNMSLQFVSVTMYTIIKSSSPLWWTPAVARRLSQRLSSPLSVLTGSWLSRWSSACSSRALCSCSSSHRSQPASFSRRHQLGRRCPLRRRAGRLLPLLWRLLTLLTPAALTRRAALTQHERRAKRYCGWPWTATTQLRCHCHFCGMHWPGTLVLHGRLRPPRRREQQCGAGA